MSFKPLLQRALEIYRNDGIASLLSSSQSYLRKQPREYFESLIARRILWGDTRFRKYTQWRHQINQRRYVAPAEPYRIIRINPKNIDTYNSEIEKEWGLARITGGNWDQSKYCKPLTRNSIFTGLRQRFVENLDWEETDYYKKAEEEFRIGGSKWGYKNLNQFREVRCQYVDDLYKAIKQNGYRPNRTDKHDIPDADSHRKQTGYIHELEPLVVIGRNGTIHWRDGFHRIAIVKIIGMEELPVQVLCRHKNWQSVRDALATANQKQQHKLIDQNPLGNHPDLRDVIEAGSFKH